MLCKNHPPVGGLSHGCVAIGYRSSEMVLKELDWPNPENFEVLCVVGNLRGHSRKVFVLAAYMPPGDLVPHGRACLAHIRDMIQMAKFKFNEPLIVTAGDFNQWDISGALSHYVDIEEVSAGPTRGSGTIDRVFVNFPRAVSDKSVLEPLETDPFPDSPKRQSDHRVVLVKAKLERLKIFEWLSYAYLFYNDESVEDFKSWITFEDWSSVRQAVGSNNKAAAYQEIVTAAVNRYFPRKTTRRKSTDLPWINTRIRKKIARRKESFEMRGGRLAGAGTSRSRIA